MVVGLKLIFEIRLHGKESNKVLLGAMDMQNDEDEKIEKTKSKPNSDPIEGAN